MRLKFQAQRESHAEYGGILGTAGLWELSGLMLGIAGMLTAVYGPDIPGFALLGLAVPVFLAETLLKKFYFPKKQELVDENSASRLIELAEKRQDSIEERDAFYGSSEWRAVRAEIIREQGKVCKFCRKTILAELDATVDHIRPRSIYPDLALVKSNLQVLCRVCNSSKGASDM